MKTGESHCAAAVRTACALARPQAVRRQPAYERANRLFTAHKYQECMNALDEALRLDPNLVPALTLRAKLAMAINRYDVAKESLERAIAADPASSYARFLYGFQFYQQNEMPAGDRGARKGARVKPARLPRRRSISAWRTKSLGSTAEALGLYRRAIHLEEAAGQAARRDAADRARLLLRARATSTSAGA